MADITRKRDRDRLKVRREPYWQKLIPGGYLGFRRGADTWIARYRTRDNKQNYQALNASDYDQAKKQAEAYFKQMGSSAVRAVRRGTVREALETYLAVLNEQGRADAAKISEQRFRGIVWNDPIAEIPLSSLTLDDMREWRERLRPGRQARTINRHVRSIVAGLNCAHKNGHIADPSAWKLTPLADDTEDGETAVILSQSQRKALIEAAEPAAALFFRGLELTGARPSELAAATVADFNAESGTIKLSHRKGRPPKLRSRITQLSTDGAAFFREQAKDKLPTALLFTDAAGIQWERHEWAADIRSAMAKHNARAKGAKRIPAGTSAYSFRHTRISELLQVHGVDPVTVAAQTGTSTRMIERAYYRFIPAAMCDKLAAIREA